MLGRNGSQRPASEPSVATMPEQPSIAHTMLGLMLWLRIGRRDTGRGGSNTQAGPQATNANDNASNRLPDLSDLPDRMHGDGAEKSRKCVIQN
jgi:hypothetical protein